MGMSVKIKMLLAAREMTIEDLAKKLNPPTTKQNLGNKFKRDNFSEAEIKAIAEACNARYEIHFFIDDTGTVL